MRSTDTGASILARGVRKFAATTMEFEDVPGFHVVEDNNDEWVLSSRRSIRSGQGSTLATTVRSEDVFVGGELLGPRSLPHHGARLHVHKQPRNPGWQLMIRDDSATVF